MNSKSVNIAHPLKYFFDLHKGALNKYYREFVSDIRYMPHNKKLMDYFYDEIEGVEHDHQLTFEDYIESPLKQNSSKVMNFLYKKVQNDDTLISTHSYVTEVKKELLTLIEDFRISDTKGSNKVEKILKSLYSEINNRLLKYIEIGLDNSKGQPGLPAKGSDIINVILPFNWIGNKFKAQILFLFHEFTRNGIIADDSSLLDFEKGFCYEPIEEPLNIRWTVLTKDKKHTSKSSLFYFLLKLEEKELIENYYLEGDNYRGVYSRVKMIFCDLNGKPFINLKQSMKYFNTSVRPPLKSEIIDTIINNMIKMSHKD